MLYIVSTPIGNLEDITLRALRILKSVSFIVCEDTRVTRVLLDKYEIKAELVSLNAQNEQGKMQYVLSRLMGNTDCALVSDAGTPLISDPGARLIHEAIKQDIPVSTLPGPSALLAAITISGLPADCFLYEGFIPQKKGRKTFLESLITTDRTVVFYESVYRIEKLVGELNNVIPGRQIAVCRELTKMFEEAWRGTAKEVFEELPNKTIKGEFVIVVAPTWWK